VASKRAVRRRQCQRKFRYRTQASADVDRRRLIRQAIRAGRNPRLNVYRCRWCGGWHVGHWKSGGVS